MENKKREKEKEWRRGFLYYKNNLWNGLCNRWISVKQTWQEAWRGMCPRRIQ